MFKYIIEIFCKDTIIGLSDFSDIRAVGIYKNRHKSLFKNKNKLYMKYFTDPIACRL